MEKANMTTVIKTRTYVTMTLMQILLSSIFIGMVAGCMSILNSMYHDYSLLPIVERSTQSEQCIRVINLDNGHAFNCNDVDLVLRRYRTHVITEQANEKLSSAGMQQLSTDD